jgi:hypothetical protein
VRLFDRFTRDEVSAKIWWPLALVGLVTLVLSVPLANRGADRARADAAVWAAATSTLEIEPLTAAGASSSQLSSTAASLVEANPTLSAVRVWDASHVLTASSDPSDQLNSNAAMNDTDLEQALTGGAVWLVTNRTMTGDPGPATFQAYIAIKGVNGSAVAEFEAPDARLLAGVHHEWMWFRIAVGLGTLLVFVLALLSMREPVARIGAGVPFYPENVPPWLQVIDVDRAIALEHAGDRAKDRLAGLQQRLEESEYQRKKTEGELQRALTALGTGGTMHVPVVLHDEEPAPARPPTERATADAAEANKRARAAQAAEKQRAKAAAAEKQRAAEAAAEKQRAAEAARAEAATPAEEPARPAAPRPDVAAAAPAPAPAEEVTVQRDDLAVSETPGRHAKKDEWPEVVVVPEEQPANVAAAGGPDSDREVLDVLHRLVPDHDADPPPADDTAELRNRLARTAALKKPGSRERQEHREDPQP